MTMLVPITLPPLNSLTPLPFETYDTCITFDALPPSNSLNPSPLAFESFDSLSFIIDIGAHDAPCWDLLELITLTS
jgi:hypothetical protein